MKEEILDIAKKLYHNHLTIETGTNLLLRLYNDLGKEEQLVPNHKEIDEAAEAFGNLYSLDGQFANGCESGYKAGAEWMRDKLNNQFIAFSKWYKENYNIKISDRAIQEYKRYGF